MMLAPLRTALIAVAAMLSGCAPSATAPQAGRIQPGQSFVTYLRHNPRVSATCGQPIALATWTSGSRLHQRFAHCKLRGTFSVLTATPPVPVSPVPQVTTTPFPTITPQPTPMPWPTTGPIPTPIPQPTMSADPIQQLIALINTHRQSYGSTPLTLIGNDTTTHHAADMAADGAIWHTSALHPLTSFPYGGFFGENVGAGPDVQQIDTGMWSEGITGCATGTISHACNIVNPRFTQVAIGLAYGNLFGWPAVFVTEDFR